MIDSAQIEMEDAPNFNMVDFPENWNKQWTWFLVTVTEMYSDVYYTCHSFHYIFHYLY